MNDTVLPQYPINSINEQGEVTHIRINAETTLLCFPQDSIDRMRAYYIENVVLLEALGEIKAYQDILERESKGIPPLERIRGNVRYYMGNVL